jgi:hypothetical protein
MACSTAAVDHDEGIGLAGASALAQVGGDRTVDAEAVGLDRVDDLAEVGVVGLRRHADVEGRIDGDLVGGDEVEGVRATVLGLEGLQRAGIEDGDVGVAGERGRDHDLVLWERCRLAIAGLRRREDRLSGLS